MIWGEERWQGNLEEGRERKLLRMYCVKESIFKVFFCLFVLRSLLQLGLPGSDFPVCPVSFFTLGGEKSQENLVSFKHFQNLFCLFSSCLNGLPYKLEHSRPRESCHSVLPHPSFDNDKELAVLCNFLVSVHTLKNSAPFKLDC